MSLNCPKCGTENTQKLSIIHSSGFTNINTTSSGVGIGIGKSGIGVGVGSGSTTGTHQNALSATYSPPPKAKDGMNVFVALVSFLIFPFLLFNFKVDVVMISSIIFCVCFFLLAVNSVRSNSKYNREVWPKLYDEWQRSFLCLRCEHVFTLKNRG